MLCMPPSPAAQEVHIQHKWQNGQGSCTEAAKVPHGNKYERLELRAIITKQFRRQ